jgi:hypothetical protein
MAGAEDSSSGTRYCRYLGPGIRRPVRAASPGEGGGRWKRPLLRQTTPATTGRRLLYAGGDPAGGRGEIGR